VVGSKTKINLTKTALFTRDENKNTKKDDGGYVIKQTIQRTVGSNE